MHNALTLVAGCLLTALIVSIVGAMHGSLSWLLLGGGAAAGIWFLYRIDSQLEANKAIAVAQKNAIRLQEYAARLRDLAGSAESHDFELSVSGSSQLMMGVILVLAGIFFSFLAFSAYSILAVLLAAATFVIASLMLLGSVPTVGKPKIVLSRSGFMTPLTPMIRWDQVEGIHLQLNTYRDRIVSYTLNFKIPTLQTEIDRFALFYRLTFLLRTRTGKERLQVVLKDTSEHHEVVYQLARFLWTAATGRKYDWNPNFSEAFNVASQHLEVAGNQEIVGAELMRKARMMRWIMYSALAAFAVYVLLRLSSIFLN